MVPLVSHHRYQWMTHLMPAGDLYVWIMIVVRGEMMNIFPRPNGGFIQMRARELDSHLRPPPPSPSKTQLLYTIHLFNLTGWRNDHETHIMYISLAVATHLHVEDS